MPDELGSVHIPLPNFVVIGAARSGTTSLHEYLGSHPQVFMCPKEPNYFALAESAIPDGPGAAWLRKTSVTTRPAYEALFEAARDATAIGDVSPRYLAAPEAPALIRSTLGERARLVAIFRNPVDRVVSAYHGLRRDGFEPEPTFEAALADQDRRRQLGWPLGAFVDQGYAGRDLRRYLQVFPRAQVKTYLYEDLVSDARGLMRDLFVFLGVDPGHVPDVTRRYGQTGLIASPVRAFLWRRTQLARMALGRIVPAPAAWREKARAWFLQDLVRVPLEPDTRAGLQRLFRDDILLLQDLLKRDLSAWLR
jgi:hypothetical protein